MGDSTSVLGLTRADFELFVNGKRQPIEYFDVVDYATLSAEQARDPRQRRLYVLVFDLVFSDRWALYRAQRAAEEYMTSARDTDLFCVASYSGRRGLEIVVPFTRDRVAVQNALQRLRDVKTDDPLRLTLTEPQRVATLGRERYSSDANVNSLALQELLAEPLRDMMRRQFDSLGELAQRLAPIEGVKHVLLLSGGFDNSGLTGIRRTSSSQMSSDTAVLTTPVLGDPYGGHRLNVMTKAFADAGVFLDTVDITGIPGPWTQLHNANLYTLAHETGGTVMTNRNDIADSLKTLANRQRIAYVLGFNAPKTGRESNSIRVVVHNRQGAEVSYRPSYSTAPVKLIANDGLRVADILLNDIPQNGVTVTTAVKTEQGKANVNVSLPKNELRGLSGGTAIRGEELIYIYRGEAVVAFKRVEVGLDGAPRYRDPDQEPVSQTQTFELKPGHYAAKVVVRFEGYDQLGFSRTDFDIE